MRMRVKGPLFVMICFTVLAHAQCAKDNRRDKHGGVLVTDFTITGTTTLSSTELTRLSSDFVGSCYSDELRRDGGAASCRVSGSWIFHR
jgi:hypothetical protein